MAELSYGFSFNTVIMRTGFNGVRRTWRAAAICTTTTKLTPALWIKVRDMDKK